MVEADRSSPFCLNPPFPHGTISRSQRLLTVHQRHRPMVRGPMHGKGFLRLLKADLGYDPKISAEVCELQSFHQCGFDRTGTVTLRTGKGGVPGGPVDAGRDRGSGGEKSGLWVRDNTFGEGTPRIGTWTAKAGIRGEYFLPLGGRRRADTG